MRFGKNLKADLQFVARWITNPLAKKGFYIGYTGHGNLGDEALRDAIFEMFFPKIIFSESKGMLVRFLEKCKILNFDLLMLGGGTLVFKSEEVLKNLMETSIKKRVIFGTGVANHEFWKDIPGLYGNRESWNKVLKEVDYLAVRGPGSQKILNSNQLGRSVRVIGDPVLYFTREQVIKKRNKKMLGVNIGATGNGHEKNLLWGRNEEDFLNRFAQFLRVMVDDGWFLEVMPVCDEDLGAISYVIKESGREKEIGIFQKYKSVHKTIDRMIGFDVFIGQKLHSAVLACCANTPAVMVEYRPKCRDFMESIQMEDFVIRTDQFTPQKAKEYVEQLYQHLDFYQEKINRVCLNYKKTLMEEADLFKKEGLR